VSDDLLELAADEFDLLNELPVCGCGRPEMAFAVYRSVLADAVGFAAMGPW
jgi:hypothetical protein